MSTMAELPAGIDLLSVSDVAEVLGVSGCRVRQLLAEGRIQGVKVHDRAWVISRTEAERVAKIERPSGRPGHRKKLSDS